MPDGSPSILILSVTAGSGHMRAASAIRAAFGDEDPGRNVIILDTFRYTSPFLERLILGAYMEMLRFTPSFYGYIYRRSEMGQPLAGYAKTEFNRLLSMFSASRLIRYIDELSPEAVICTHPFPLGVLSSIRQRGGLRYFTVGVITDFIIHPFWVFPEVDLYLVGAGLLAGDFAGFGIPVEKVYATGIPIDPAFARPVDRWAVRSGCGLQPDLPTILVMGGGLGLGPLAESVRALASMDRRCQLMVVAGNNDQLREKILHMAPDLPNRVCVMGYVNNIRDLMAASDIMVSKAGGLSCAEAMASGIPLFILDPLPGQEERNTRFLTSAGAAVEVGRVGDLVEKVTICLDKPDILRAMSEAALRTGRPEAAASSVRLIKSMISDFYSGGSTCI